MHCCSFNLSCTFIYKHDEYPAQCAFRVLAVYIIRNEHCCMHQQDTAQQMSSAQYQKVKVSSTLNSNYEESLKDKLRQTFFGCDLNSDKTVTSFSVDLFIFVYSVHQTAWGSY